MTATDAPDSARPRHDAGLRRGFRDGGLAGLPFLVVAIPFGMLFGAVATESGLDLLSTMAMTSIVIAGASQFAFLQLMNDGAPAFAAFGAALAVNLRMAMYSASLAPHLGAAPLRWRLMLAYFNVDQVYAASIARYQDRPAMGLWEKIGFYLGVAAPIFPAWIGGTLAGALVGRGIPPEWSLDFAPAVTFIAVFAPMLRSLAALAACAVSVAAALALSVLPWSLGLPIAGALGMAAGAGAELWLERRAARHAAADAAGDEGSAVDGAGA
ncbi:MAG: AzlC family ABC transporter permease [Pseudomonadota bacterium]